VPAGHHLAMADAIQQLMQLPFEERLRLGHNGRRYLEQHHTYSHLARELANQLNALVPIR